MQVDDFPLDRCMKCHSLWLYPDAMLVGRCFSISPNQRHGLDCPFCEQGMTRLQSSAQSAYRCTHHGLLLPAKSCGLLPVSVLHEVHTRDAIDHWEAERLRLRDEQETPYLDMIVCSWRLLVKIARYLWSTIHPYDAVRKPDDV